MKSVRLLKTHRNKGGSRISGKGVHMYNGVHECVCVCVCVCRGSHCCLLSFFLGAIAGNTPHIMFLILFIQFVFMFSLNQNKVDKILNSLNDMTQPNEDDINVIMSEIRDIFKTTRINAFDEQKSQNFNDKPSTNSKLWFNNHEEISPGPTHL